MIVLYVDRQDQKDTLSLFIEKNHESNGVLTPTRAMEWKIKYWGTNRSL